MPSTSGTNRPARTLLEQLIHERNQTLEEFAAYAETFAREHNEPGTLSAGHLQRLVAGRRYDGRPLGRVRPATARLLERIFDSSIEELLAAPQSVHDDSSAAELRDRLQASSRVDLSVVRLLHEQLDAIRRLDRQLGSAVAHEEVRTKISQLDGLLSYSISPDIRALLAALLAEFCMLAGWQALDLRKTLDSWHFYQQARFAANECNLLSFSAHAAAQKAFVLIDLNKTAEAVQILAQARTMTTPSAPKLTRSWLAAAHGEALAANNQPRECLGAFEDADKLLSNEASHTKEGPYVALDATHLERWRGHALARLRIAEAVPVLSSALERHDFTFTRAETSLCVDLSLALYSNNEREEASKYANRASRLASAIDSKRQQRRVQSLGYQIDDA